MKDIKDMKDFLTKNFEQRTKNRKKLRGFKFVNWTKTFEFPASSRYTASSRRRRVITTIKTIRIINILNTPVFILITLIILIIIISYP